MWNNMVDKYNSLSKKDNKRQCKKKKKPAQPYLEANYIPNFWKGSKFKQADFLKPAVPSFKIIYSTSRKYMKTKMHHIVESHKQRKEDAGRIIQLAWKHAGFYAFMSSTSLWIFFSEIFLPEYQNQNVGCETGV